MPIKRKIKITPRGVQILRNQVASLGAELTHAKQAYERQRLEDSASLGKFMQRESELRSKLANSERVADVLRTAANCASEISFERGLKIETLKKALWEAEKESNERKKLADRLMEEVGQLETNLDLAAERNAQQERLFLTEIDYRILLEANLHREISELRTRLFVATLAPVIFEWAKPGEHIDVPPCLKPADALKYQAQRIAQA